MIAMQNKGQVLYLSTLSLSIVILKDYIVFCYRTQQNLTKNLFNADYKTTNLFVHTVGTFINIDFMSLIRSPENSKSLFRLILNS